MSTRDVVVRLFGPAADALGAPSVTVAVPLGALHTGAGEVTCGALRKALLREVPALRPFVETGRIAVSHAFARDARRILPDEEVALIAMVGGG